MDPAPTGLVPARLPTGDVAPPDRDREPDAFVVAANDDVRIHFLDWGGSDGSGIVVLVPGLGRTAWDWAGVARRLASVRRVVAMDLRGHGLSDAPQDGYGPDEQASDVLAVAEAAGFDGSGARPLVLAGHGYGAVVAVLAAARTLPDAAGLVLVDGGWERVEETTGQDVDEALRTMDEPPEVMRSMAAYLADRSGWDPASWDVDQERAARATIVETASGRLVRVARPHVLEAGLRLLYAYDPLVELAPLPMPVTVLAARDVDAGRRERALRRLGATRAAQSRPPIRLARFPADGHNLLRYRPAEVAAAILSATEGPS